MTATHYTHTAGSPPIEMRTPEDVGSCLLYTSDAADD